MIEIVHRRVVANGIEIGYRKDGNLMGIVFGDETQLLEWLAAGARCDDAELSVACRIWYAKTPTLADVAAMKDKEVKVDYSKDVPVSVTAKVVK